MRPYVNEPSRVSLDAKNPMTGSLAERPNKLDVQNRVGHVVHLRPRRPIQVALAQAQFSVSRAEHLSQNADKSRDKLAET